MRLREEQIRSLLEASRETHDVEIDCEAFLELVGSCAEARADGRATAPGLEKVLEHERLCANCREELAALVAMLEQEKE